MNNDQLLEEIRLRCGDPKGEDFSPPNYGRMLHRAKRIVARKYKLVQRKFSFKVTAKNNEALEDIVKVYVPSFDGETMVKVNDVDYTKAKDNKVILDSHTYDLHYDNRNLLLLYSPRSLSDDVTIFYVSDVTIEDYDEESFEPIIHTRYEEELINITTISIAKLGIAKFTGDKLKRYTNILRLYNGEPADPSLTPNVQWSVIKVWPIV